MLKKVIEFPLFHVGTFTSQSGAKVPMTEALLRQVEKNTNFILRSKVLQAPIGYDHPAKYSSAHGTLIGTRFQDGVLYAQGDNWSDDLVADVKSRKRLAYSGELAPNFSYPDGSGKMVDVGPAVVGLAILGAQRPAIKNLKPLSDFEFHEGTSAADAYLTREQLRSTGLVSEYCEANQFFGEVENDARRFFSETKEQPMTPEDKAEFQRMLDAQTAAHKAEMAALKTETAATIKSFSEEEKVKKARMDFAESVITEKPTGKLFSEAVRAFAADPSWDNGKSMLLALPAIITKDKATGNDDKSDDGDEPKELADLTPKMFSELSKYDSEIAAGMVAFQAKYPKKYAAIKDKPQSERLAALKQHLIEREADA